MRKKNGSVKKEKLKENLNLNNLISEQIKPY